MFRIGGRLKLFAIGRLIQDATALPCAAAFAVYGKKLRASASC
jgi:hypothetical protein